MVNMESAADVRLAKGEESWLLGSRTQVDWITAGTGLGLRITAAIPPIFAAYATVIAPDVGADRKTHDEALLAVLGQHSQDQDWWLGYLDTGGDDVVFPQAPRVQLYAHWQYVLIRAGMEQAATWRSNDVMSSWRGALPDLIFPSDHSWLASRLWDDDWRCIGGSAELIDTLCHNSRLDARSVTVDQDATPPGHQAR